MKNSVLKNSKPIRKEETLKITSKEYVKVFFKTKMHFSQKI
jgi:hypothetical protein